MLKDIKMFAKDFIYTSSQAKNLIQENANVKKTAKNNLFSFFLSKKCFYNCFLLHLLH